MEPIDNHLTPCGAERLKFAHVTSPDFREVMAGYMIAMADQAIPH